jgi:hypothetical protein
MASVRVIAAVCTLALSSAVATLAHADPLITDPSKALADRNQWASQTTHKTFEWDATKSRWGLKFDVQQEAGAFTDWKNVQAGAYFKVTPSLRVGAGVTLSDSTTTANGSPIGQPAVPPRVHLETAFKF